MGHTSLVDKCSLSRDNHYTLSTIAPNIRNVLVTYRVRLASGGEDVAFAFSVAAAVLMRQLSGGRGSLAI